MMKTQDASSSFSDASLGTLPRDGQVSNGRGWSRQASRFLLGTVLLNGILGIGNFAHGQLKRLSGDDAVQAGAEGLRSEASFPWYDREKDELHPLTLRTEKAPKEAKDWTAAKKKTKKQTKRTKRQSWNWDFLGDLSLFMQVAVYGFLIALVALAVYFFVNNTDIQLFQSPNDKDDDAEDEKTDEERMENLPFEVRRPRSNLLDEAKRLYDAGRYGEAVVYLFSYQLLQLDKNQWIRLAKGKTNRQYVREIRGGRDLQGILQKTMVPFEDFFFGHYAIERERFESCWGRLDEFHRLVKAEGATT